MILGALRALVFASVASMLFVAPASAVQWIGKFDPLSVLGQGGDQNADLAKTISGRRLNAFNSLTCANSAVQGRVLPTTDVISGSVGTPVVLSALNINCAQPAGAVQVTVSPGGQIIQLADDGILFVQERDRDRQLSAVPRRLKSGELKPGRA